MAKAILVKVSSFYPQYLNKLYAENPELKYKPYAEQYRVMMLQGIGWADYWITNLNQSTEVEATLFIINNAYAQQKWAEENNVTYSTDNWMQEILLEQIKAIKPDILFANDYVYLKAADVKAIKREVPSIKKVIGWDGIGMLDTEIFSACDTMISCVKRVVEYYQSKGFDAYLFQFGFESSLLQKIDTRNKIYDVSFAGSLTLRSGGHHERLKILGYVAKKCNVHYWLSSFDENKVYLLKNVLQKLGGGEFADVEDILRLVYLNKGSVFGLSMYQVLANSQITLNSHIDTAQSAAGNIRLWEATGVGACLVTDWKENLSDLFKPDIEVVTYQTKEECVEKINYLLNHPQQMKAIAEAGQKRTLEQYSYAKRMKELIPFLLR
jgi:spore maturation protein CgeB